MKDKPILTINHFTKKYGNGCDQCQTSLVGNYCPHCQTVYACNDVSLSLYPGECLGIVGESGSGKSTLMKALYLGLEDVEGSYYLEAFDHQQHNIFEISIPKQTEIRNMLLGMVYQNPMLGLRMDYGSLTNIAEKMIAAKHLNVGAIVKRGETLLQQVAIPKYRMKEAPKQFSGGMQQRVQIAKALSNNPPILLLDEITTGLDLSVQADVLDLIKKIQRSLQVSMIVVSHDLAVIRMLAQRTIVMVNGQIVETGLTDQILEDPQHPYTQQLVYSLL